MRRQHFHPMQHHNGTFQKRSSHNNKMGKRRYNQSSSSFSWLRSLGCILGRGRQKSAARRGAPSPDKTALMSSLDEEEEKIQPSSSEESPCLFLSNTKSKSADSSDYGSRLGFPYWESPSPVASFSRTFDVDTDVESTSTSKEEEDKLRKSLQSLLKSNRYRVPMDAENTMNAMGVDYSDDHSDDFDNETHHFSTSTDPTQSTTFNTRISVTESVGPSGLPPPSDRSVNTARSSFTKGSRVSLEQFMSEERRTVQTAAMTNLGEISALDTASVSSALMTVSFDEDYPQLVMTPSHDGSSRWSSGTLGASYPHPAAGSVASWDTAKKKVPCTPCWLDANIDMVWQQFDDEDDGAILEDDDGGATLEDDDDDGATYEEEEDDESCGESTVGSSSSKKGGQEDTAIVRTRSFSPDDDGVGKSISDMIGESVIQPMLRPICHFVDATEIPQESASSDVRPPLSENGANARST